MPVDDDTSPRPWRALHALTPAPPLASFARGVPLVPRVIARAREELVEQPDPLAFMESCVVRCVGAGVAGAAMGFLFGAIFSGYGALAPYDPALRDWQASAAAQQQRAGGAASGAAAGGVARPPGAMVASTPWSPPIPGSLPIGNVHVLPGEAPAMPMARIFREGLVEMRVRGIASGRSFGIVGGIYTGVECSLERLRGIKDLKGAVISGFTTGAVLAARAGPAAMLLGGAGFGAFSAVIEIASPYIFE